MEKEKECACVVVLGDIGRSPRMQYHALSLAKEGFNVDVVGYGGSEPVKELANHPNVMIRNLTDCPDLSKRCPQLLVYALKVLWQSITLFCALLFKRRSHHVIVQNPPAIPTLAVCWFYCVLASANYVIDWHNYGHTIMALKLGRKHRLVQVSEWFEGYFGKKARSNLCVTIAMKDDLKKKWGITAVTLYDRPPEAFRPMDLSEQHTFFLQLAADYPQFRIPGVDDETLFTEVDKSGNVASRSDRPGLLISSTSWTEDEDFSVLLTALQEYEETRSRDETRLPRLLCAITGKGPLKEYYCNLIGRAEWKHVEVITPWLRPEDYPKLLASSDLGVCLHTSSSGLDLPMKVVDMFGCRLPVLAYNFPCLNELVQHGKNSYVFNDAQQLSTRLQTWFRSFPNNAEQQEINQTFRKQLDIFRQLRWHDNWTTTAFCLFNNLPWLRR